MDVAVIVGLHSPLILKFSRTLPEVEVRTQMPNAVGLSVRCHGPGCWPSLDSWGIFGVCLRALVLGLTSFSLVPFHVCVYLWMSAPWLSLLSALDCLSAMCVLLSPYVKLCVLVCVSVSVSCTSCFIVVVTCPVCVMFSFVQLCPGISSVPQLAVCCAHLVLSQFVICKPSNKAPSKCLGSYPACLTQRHDIR